MNVQRGWVRDAIISYLDKKKQSASIAEIVRHVESVLGVVSRSSVRSYLSLNTPEVFTRVQRGRYELNREKKFIDLLGYKNSVELSDEATKTQKIEDVDLKKLTSQNTSYYKKFEVPEKKCEAIFNYKNVSLQHGDCLELLKTWEPRSFEAVVTDPPYGIVEYSKKEISKLRQKKGGIWRIPPTLDGKQRSPLPRFTVLNAQETDQIRLFFRKLGTLLLRVTVPGANIVVASNTLLFHVTAQGLIEAGLEPRGSLARLVTTLRGGDRPKNAHDEFPHVSVMPRSQWEPWLVFRHPLEGRVQDNLRAWKTGGFRRTEADAPFGDVIKSAPARAQERRIAPHPTLKPQSFLRQLVRASLPLGEGTILDPFAGSGSTLAAAAAVGYACVGIEQDLQYVEMATKAVPALAALKI